MKEMNVQNKWKERQVKGSRTFVTLLEKIITRLQFLEGKKNYMMFHLNIHNSRDLVFLSRSFKWNLDTPQTKKRGYLNLFIVLSS